MSLDTPADTSYYAATAHPAPPRPPLDGDRTVDVCVVGAGFCGLSTALSLAEKGYSVLVLEKHHVGFGASGRNGGQVGIDFSKGTHGLKGTHSREERQRLFDMTVRGVDLVFERAETYQIRCDPKPRQMLTGVKPRHDRELAEHAEYLDDMGYTAYELLDRVGVQDRVRSDRYTSGLLMKRAGHVHPLNYCLGLARAAEQAGAVICERSPMLSFTESDPVKVTTPNGTVTARFLVLAGNAYLWGQVPALQSRIMPTGTYVIATEPLGKEGAETVMPGDDCVNDIRFVLDYFRLSADKRMLWGGRVSYSRFEPHDLAHAMQADMLKVFPQLRDRKVTHAWGGYVAITVNRFPNVGSLRPNIFYAQGFSGHGVAMTGIVGEVLSDAVAGTAERFDLFARIKHTPFPGGKYLRTPLLVLATTYYRIRDLL